jgi:hypothetical protein
MAKIVGKGWQLLMPWLETQVLCVERRGAGDILDLVSDAMEFEREARRFLHGNVIARRHA